MSTDLNTPILEGGLRRIPFFNGRVLTAEDLSTEQAANATERRRLGRAHGTGVLEGLFVRETTASTTVLVEPGLALAPSGRVVELPQRTEVSVVSEIELEETVETEGQFANCATQHAIAESGTGAYLLVLKPASGTQGRVPRTSLGGDGMAGECGAQHRVEGARLRLVCLNTSNDALVPPSIQGEVHEQESALTEALLEDSDPGPATIARLRNLLAHACLRTPQAHRKTSTLYSQVRAVAQGRSPTQDNSPFGPTDIQAYTDLGSDAVPIGLLYWARDHIRFVDAWSARRRVHRTDPQRPVPVTDRRSAEAEAAFYQFQKHLAELVRQETTGGVAEIGLKDHFRFMPAASLVPLVNSAGRPGVLPEAFLDGVPARDPIYTEGRRVSRLLRAAILTPPIDLAHGTALRTYYVRENAQRSDAGETPSEADAGDRVPYMLLAGGSLPFIGDPRFDLAHWDYAHFPEPGDL